jgi:GMP synthase (glutamine-hydrolysing)
LLHVWMSHGDKVTAMPPGFKLMASTSNCPVAGMADESRGFYAVQFHPEVTHTKQGKAMLTHFVRDPGALGWRRFKRRSSADSSRDW